MQSAWKELHGKSRRDVTQTGRRWRQSERSRYSTDIVTRELVCLRESAQKLDEGFQKRDANSCLPAVQGLLWEPCRTIGGFNNGRIIMQQGKGRKERWARKTKVTGCLLNVLCFITLSCALPGERQAVISSWPLHIEVSLRKWYYIIFSCQYKEAQYSVHFLPDWLQSLIDVVIESIYPFHITHIIR